MAILEFKQTIGRIYFDGGLKEEEKLIRKSKSFHNIAENVGADSLYYALEQLAQLSTPYFSNI